MDNGPEQPNKELNAEFKTCKTLITFANVLGPLSLLLGGIVMGAAGLICAIVSFVKSNRLIKVASNSSYDFKRLNQAAKVSIGICIAAIIINAIALYIFMPQMLEVLQSIDLNDLSSLGSSGSVSGSSGTGSTWG